MGPNERRAMSRQLEMLNVIQSCFPGRDRLIEKALHESRSFQDLCTDYRKCFVALHRWKKRAAPEACQRRQEYTDLLMELGRDIETWLEEMDITPSGRGTGVRP